MRHSDIQIIKTHHMLAYLKLTEKKELFSF